MKMRKVYISPLMDPKRVEAHLRHRGYSAIAYTGGQLEKGKIPFWTDAPNSALKGFK